MAKRPAKKKAAAKAGGKAEQLKQQRANKAAAAKEKADKVTRAAKGTKKVEQPAARAPVAIRVPSKEELQGLLKRNQQALDQAAEVSGAARQKLGEAVEKINLDTYAFGIVRRLRKIGLKDPAKLRTKLDNLHDYIEKADLEKLAGEGLFDETRMETDPPAEDGGEEKGGEGDQTLPTNVTRIGGQPEAA